MSRGSGSSYPEPALSGPAGGLRSDPGAAWAPTRVLPVETPQSFFPASKETAALALASPPRAAPQARPGRWGGQWRGALGGIRLRLSRDTTSLAPQPRPAHAGDGPQPQGHADTRAAVPHAHPLPAGSHVRFPVEAAAAGPRASPTRGALAWDARRPRSVPRGNLPPYSQAAPGHAPPGAIAAPRRPRRLRLPSRGAAQATKTALPDAATAAHRLRFVTASPLPSMNGAPSSERLRTSLDLAACGAPR